MVIFLPTVWRIHRVGLCPRHSAIWYQFDIKTSVLYVSFALPYHLVLEQIFIRLTNIVYCQPNLSANQITCTAG